MAKNDLGYTIICTSASPRGEFYCTIMNSAFFHTAVHGNGMTLADALEDLARWLRVEGNPKSHAMLAEEFPPPDEIPREYRERKPTQPKKRSGDLF